MTKDKLWSFSLCFFFLLFLIVHQWRLISGILLALHLPVLIWGICNCNSGFFHPSLFKKRSEGKKIAITFDDGPDPHLTPDIVALLDEFKFIATFFIIAERAKKHPEIVRSAFDKGHTIACHDKNHSVFTNFRFSKKMFAEISEAREILFEIIGKKPLLYRPPFGLSNPHLGNVLRILEMHLVGWKKSAKDFGNRRPTTFSRFESLAEPGAVVLFHDTLSIPESKDSYLMNLRRFFERLKREGYETETVDSLFSITAYE